MIEQDYAIGSLVATFLEHAKMQEQHNEQVVNAFKEHNPGVEIPYHLANPFNVSQALSVMAYEIEELKHQLRQQTRNEHR